MASPLTETVWKLPIPTTETDELETNPKIASRRSLVNAVKEVNDKIAIVELMIECKCQVYYSPYALCFANSVMTYPKFRPARGNPHRVPSRHDLR